MRRIILACAIAGILGVPAKADETLKWRQVQHYTSNQNQQVGDVERHAMGLARLVGIALFPDGSIAGTTVVVGTFDSTPPSDGAANGYGGITFADGSELWVKWTGTISYRPKITEKGTMTVVGGKGRYAGAKGDGTWGLPGIVGSGADVIQIIDNVINIKK